MSSECWYPWLFRLGSHRYILTYLSFFDYREELYAVSSNQPTYWHVLVSTPPGLTGSSQFHHAGEILVPQASATGLYYILAIYSITSLNNIILQCFYGCYYGYTIMVFPSTRYISQLPFPWLPVGRRHIVLYPYFKTLIPIPAPVLIRSPHGANVACATMYT